MIKKIIKLISFKTGEFKSFYIKFCKPSTSEYTKYEKKWGNFYPIGINCTFWQYTNITDPEYTRLGNSVMLAACTILGHDGSIAVLNEAYDRKLDRVVKVDIKDNVFVGHGAIILPDVTIGPNAITAAGAVVSTDVPKGSIVGGVPAKVIGKLDDLVERLKNQTEVLPWAHIIQSREGSFGSKMEPLLKKMRQEYFFWEVSLKGLFNVAGKAIVNTYNDEDIISEEGLSA